MTDHRLKRKMFHLVFDDHSYTALHAYTLREAIEAMERRVTKTVIKGWMSTPGSREERKHEHR